MRTTVAISGFVYAYPGTANVVPNAAVDVVDLQGATVAGGATNAAGEYSVGAPLTNGVFDGYFKFTGGAYFSTYFHTGGPLSTSGAFDVQMFTDVQLDELAQTCQTALDSRLAVIFLVTDTSGRTLVVPDGANNLPLCYLRGDWTMYQGLQGATATTSTALAVTFNVPEGSYTPYVQGFSGSRSYAVVPQTVSFIPVAP